MDGTGGRPGGSLNVDAADSRVAEPAAIAPETTAADKARPRRPRTRKRRIHANTTLPRVIPHGLAHVTSCRTALTFYRGQQLTWAWRALTDPRRRQVSTASTGLARDSPTTKTGSRHPPGGHSGFRFGCPPPRSSSASLVAGSATLRQSASPSLCLPGVLVAVSPARKSRRRSLWRDESVDWPMGLPEGASAYMGPRRRHSPASIQAGGSACSSGCPWDRDRHRDHQRGALGKSEVVHHEHRFVRASAGLPRRGFRDRRAERPPGTCRNSYARGSHHALLRCRCGPIARS